MNLVELNEWLKSATYIDTTERDHDSCGNCWETRIFEKDGQNYKLGYCNNHPNPKWDADCGNMSERDKNGVRLKDNHGQYLYIYEPTPVKKTSYKKITEVVEYIPEVIDNP